jgi:glutathione S-transferase
MITIHHLRIGRSIFTVWLLEELGLEYELKEYSRHPETFRSPPELKQAYPLGKSPVIDIDGFTLAESGAITAYLMQHYDPEHKFSPVPSDREAWGTFLTWLHYSEGSVFTSLLIKMLLARMDPAPAMLDGWAQAEIDLNLGHIANQLGGNEFILGDKISGADFGITYAVSMAERVGQLENYTTLKAYINRNQARPAFLRALKRGVE